MAEREYPTEPSEWHELYEEYARLRKWAERLTAAYIENTGHDGTKCNDDCGWCAPLRPLSKQPVDAASGSVKNDG